MSTNHKWKFFRAGGFDQVKLETGADLLALDELDQKLWVALACPTTGLYFDQRTLALIDTDKDGRVRARELIAAVKWAAGLLKNPDDLVKRLSPLPLSAINESVPEGKQLALSARTILTNLGKRDATAISVDDTVDTAKIFAQTAFNGDGVIVEDSGADDETKAVIRDILACVGSEPDRSGKPGISQAKVDQFFAEAAAFSDWWKKAEADPAVMVAGERTAAASAAVKVVKVKVDDYFARCRLAAFDQRAMNALNREEKDYLAIAAKDLTISSTEISALPLARIEAGRALPLAEGLNPGWAGAIAGLASAAITPILGARTSLTEGDWATLQAKLAAYDAWVAGKAGALVEKLGVARVRSILGSKAKETLAALIAKDKAEEGNVASINAVERLTRYVRDLHLLCTNFVNFKDFYDRGEPAIFQMGTLYLDQRSCELTLPVEDAGKHANMAGLAGAYLAYIDCARKGSGEKMSLVSIFSQGDDDNLMVGRNGIFYDRKGRDWDATITKIIANPISLRQAFWLPYKKFARFIEEQVAKRAAAAETSSTAKLQAAATKVAEADKTAPSAAKPPEKKVDVGTVAALGVAFGAIGGFAAAIWGQMLGIVALGPLAIVGAMLGLMALISGPSVILAYIKLRKRNLGPILDANGWAINAKAKINVPFGTTLTGIAKLPPGSERDLVDPFAEKKSPWPKIIVLALVLYTAYAILNKMGYIYDWTNGRLGTEKKAKAAQVQVDTTGTNAAVQVNVNPAPAATPPPAK
jgi:hypothetical protein